MKRNCPTVLNLSGPYAVGKDSILNALKAAYPTRVYRVRTITTRPVSLSADPTYEQVTPIEFERRISDGGWIANYQLSGLTAYATSLSEIAEMTDRGQVCILSVYASPAGAGRLREVFGRTAYSIGLLPVAGTIDAQLRVLRLRLTSRNRDDPSALEARLMHQREPLQYVLENPTVQTQAGPMRVFDELVINESLDATVQTVVQNVAKIFELAES